MADQNTDSSVAGESRKRRRIDANLPNKVQLTTSMWLHNNHLHSELPGPQHGEKVEVFCETEKFLTLKVLNRGCRRYIAPTNGRGRSPFHDTHVYYVGIEGSEFCPVFLCGNGTGKYMQSSQDTNNSYSTTAFALGEVRKAASFVIPPCDMLRWPQMTFLKEQAFGMESVHVQGDGVRHVSNAEYAEYRAEQSQNVEKGRACSVLINDSDKHPSYDSLPNTCPHTWRGFRMLMPKIGGKLLPAALEAEVALFLAKYTRDLVDLSFAVSMAIVWCRLVSIPGYQPEQCTLDHNGDARRRVPRPTLAIFLLYAPHFFRFHEEHSLAAYGHIFRYASTMYVADVTHDEDAFYIAKTDINQSRIIDLVDGLHLQDSDWLEIVPPSFHGSLLLMPAGYGNKAPRSEETTASLMIPDVYALGLPDYKNNMKKGHGRVTRKILIHKRWVPPHVRNDISVAEKHKGRNFLKASALRRYNDKGSPQLWSLPRTTVQAPWIDVNSPRLSILPRPQAIPAAVPELPGQPQQHPSSMIPRQPVVEFSQKLTVQFRIAQEKGFITPNVRLGDSGLVWEGIQEENKCTKRLHSDISIDQMVAADAAVQADLLGDYDKNLLLRLLGDLEGGSRGNRSVPLCFRSFRDAVDLSEEDYTKSSLAAQIQELGRPVETAMKQITEYGNSDRQGEAAFVKHIIEPCCVLLDVDYPGTPVEGHRVIVQSDLDVGMAVSAIMYLRMLPDTGNLRDAVQKLKYSERFIAGWRFLLFKDRLMSIEFDEERKNLWQKAFGEPFERL